VDIASLQEFLDRTLARANRHAASIVSPERRLNDVTTGGRAARFDISAQVRRAAPRTWTESSGSVGMVARRSSNVAMWHRRVERLWREIYDSSPFEWGDGVVFMRIEPPSIWAYAFHPDLFPE
jgi:hypothetical protein